MINEAWVMEMIKRASVRPDLIQDGALHGIKLIHEEVAKWLKETPLEEAEREAA